MAPMSGPILTTASETVQRAMWDVIAEARVVNETWSEEEGWRGSFGVHTNIGPLQDLGLAFDGLDAALAAEGATIEAFTGERT